MIEQVTARNTHTNMYILEMYVCVTMHAYKHNEKRVNFRKQEWSYMTVYSEEREEEMTL